MKCKKCTSAFIVKNGKSKNGAQRYYCRYCFSSFQINYDYNSCKITDKQIVLLTKESCGIRSTARILNISPSTVIRRIKKIAHTIKRPYPVLRGKIYEVDELFTYVRNKNNRICIAYSFEPETGFVMDISVGRRNKSNLRKVTDTLLLSDARQICTDNLDIYKTLIPESIHTTKARSTNHIERKHLSLRTHLKRLNRKTLCFSKSVCMLLCIVKIYLLGMSRFNFQIPFSFKQETKTIDY